MLTRPKLLLFAVLCAFLLPMTASAAPRSGYDDEIKVTTSTHESPSASAQATQVADRDVKPDNAISSDAGQPAAPDLETHLYWRALFAGVEPRTRSRRGGNKRKRGTGPLTKSQKLFQSAAKVCQSEMRSGEINTKAGMGSCMRSELKDRGFKVGGAKRKRGRK